MKIICVGRNYVAHALELKNEVPDEPVLFMKPQTSYLPHTSLFYYPAFTNELHYECEIVLRIGKNGKNIFPNRVNSYISDISLGIDFTARDVQDILKFKRLPWEKAKAFDHSAVVGDFLPYTEEMQRQLTFTLQKDDTIVQRGDTSLMIFSFKKLIANMSNYFTLNIGDLIFTGTPAGVGPCVVGDKFEGKLGDIKLLEFEVK